MNTRLQPLVLPDTLSPLCLASLAFAALFAVCLVLQAIDPRLLNAAGVWVKPSKFFASLGLHIATLAWGLSLLPKAPRWIAPAFISLACFEMAYMVFRAARGEASHFNSASSVAVIFYGLMGVAAVGMMIITLHAGWLIPRRGHPRDLAFATGLGFILAAVLTTLVAGYLSSQSSHWIGGDQSDATGLPVFGWSTTGGDLRASHFVALHMMQAVPLAGWIGGKRLAIIAGFLGTILTAALFVQALMGIPVISF